MRLGPITERYVTVGGTTRNHIVPYMPDMSWLGDPPTEQQSARYEIKRAAVVAASRRALDSELDSVAKTFVETPRQRKLVNAKLNELHAQKAKLT